MRAPQPDAGIVRSPAGLEDARRTGGISDRLTRPLWVVHVCARTWMEAHRGPPQTQLHRRDQLADALESAIRVARSEISCVVRSVPARVGVGLAGGVAAVRLPVSGARLPAVVQDERFDSEILGD